MFAAPPAAAAWQHRDARRGFEIVFFESHDHGCRLRGCTTAVENGQAWAVDYTIRVDSTWTTRGARITTRSAFGARSVRVEADGVGNWRVDGESAPGLAGCLDVDLESSAMTNGLPVRRMRLALGAQATAPAAYVAASDPSVHRLEQHYRRVPGEDTRQHYDYVAPAYGFEGRLVYDESGLVVSYPGVADRVPVSG